MNLLRACKQFFERYDPKKFIENHNALRMACQDGNVKEVKSLLKQKYINPALDGSWVLLQSVSDGHLEIVRLLLKHPKIDPSIKKYWPIRIACQEGHLEIVKLFLEKTNSAVQVRCAIREAILFQQVELVKFLLQYYYNSYDIQFFLSSSTFADVCRTGHFEMVKILIEFASGTGLLCGFKIASKLGYLKIVKLLLQYGVDPATQNSYAIRWAIKNGHLEIVRLLLENGANPTELAIRNANTDEMRELLVQWKYRVDGKEYCKAKEMVGL